MAAVANPMFRTAAMRPGRKCLPAMEITSRIGRVPNPKNTMLAKDKARPPAANEAVAAKYTNPQGSSPLAAPNAKIDGKDRWPRKREKIDLINAGGRLSREPSGTENASAANIRTPAAKDNHRWNPANAIDSPTAPKSAPSAP